MDAYWTYVLSRLTFQLTISKFHSTKQSTAEYNRTLDADQAQMMLWFVRAIVARAGCTQSKGLRDTLLCSGHPEK
ncbi:hypothetical protein T08_8473, partial [Trichinella sp. T8]